MKNNVVIGIAGGSGSGKSTMINLIKKEFNATIFIISVMTKSRLKSAESSITIIRMRLTRIL